jgi:hypothetical protein
LDPHPRFFDFFPEETSSLCDQRQRFSTPGEGFMVQDWISPSGLWARRRKLGGLTHPIAAKLLGKHPRIIVDRVLVSDFSAKPLPATHLRWAGERRPGLQVRLLQPPETSDTHVQVVLERLHRNSRISILPRPYAGWLHCRPFCLDRSGRRGKHRPCCTRPTESSRNPKQGE